MAANLAWGGRCAHAPPWSVPSSWFHFVEVPKSNFTFISATLKAQILTHTLQTAFHLKSGLCRNILHYYLSADFICIIELRVRCCPPHAAMARLSLPLARGQFPSVSLRPCADGVTSSLWNGPMLMQLLLTLADRCDPPFLWLSAARYTILCRRQLIYKRKFTEFIIYILQTDVITAS